MRIATDIRSGRKRLPQLHHWWFADERIGGAQSDSYALYTRAGFETAYRYHYRTSA